MKEHVHQLNSNFTPPTLNSGRTYFMGGGFNLSAGPRNVSWSFSSSEFSKIFSGCHIRWFKSTDISETDSISIIRVLIQLDIQPTPIIFLHQARAHGSTQSNRVKVSSLLGGDTVPQSVQFLTFWRSIVPSSSWLCSPRRVAGRVYCIDMVLVANGEHEWRDTKDDHDVHWVWHM